MMNARIRSLRLNTLGVMLYPRGSSLGPRLREQFELVWAKSGSFDVNVDGHDVSISGDDVLFLKPRQVNYFRFDENTPTRHGYVTFRLDAPDESRAVVLSPLVLRGPFTRMYLPLLNKLCDGLRSVADCDPDDLRRLQQVLSMFVEGCFWPVLSRLDPTSASNAALERALIFLHGFWANGFEKSLKVSRLADSAGVSTRHLGRLFQAEFGVSPREYLRRQRLEHGARLLERSNLSIQGIGFACGFANEFAFSRAFKSVYAIPPRAYQKKMRAD